MSVVREGKLHQAPLEVGCMKELDALRDEIRSIDKNLVVLFERRMALSRDVALCKLKENKPIYDEAREKKNIEVLSSMLEDVADQPYFKKWYQLLMDLSKEKQKDTGKES